MSGDAPKKLGKAVGDAAAPLYGSMLGGPLGAYLGYSAVHGQPTAPTPNAPPPPPTQAQTNQSALNSQLQIERQMRASSTVLTQQGVLDNPTTASAVLLGS